MMVIFGFGYVNEHIHLIVLYDCEDLLDDAYTGKAFGLVAT